MSRAAANQEQGTKNQEQPRSGFNSQKTSPFKRRGFFMAVARTTKNEELRTKNSRAAAPNFNCRHRRPSFIRNPSSLISPEGYR